MQYIVPWLQQLESENTHPNKVRYLAELMKVHEEERRKSRRYLHALEQDNEVGCFGSAFIQLRTLTLTVTCLPADFVDTQA